MPRWDDVIRRLNGWAGAGVIFAIAFVAYWIEALAWPLQRGRDSWDYWLYYLQLGDRHPVFWAVQLFRTPLTPLITGIPMSIGGARLLEVVMAVIYAATVVGWAWAARPFGAVCALSVATVVLAFQLPYATLFHQISSDFVFAALLPLWAGLVVRAVLRPNWAVLTGVGVVAAALTLARPAGQVMVIAALCAGLVGAGSLRVRALRTAIVLAAAVLPLLVWAGVNDARYHDFTVARGGKAWVPFFKVFGHGRIDPANGPASRRLGAAVERDVLTQPAFRRDSVGVETYFHGPSNFETIRLIALSDRDFGRSSAYDVLYDSAVEAIRANPGWYARSVGSTLWGFVSQRFALEPVRRGEPFPPAEKELLVQGKPMPSPDALSPLVSAVPYGFVWCPTDEIDRCILANPASVFRDARERRRYQELVGRVRKWNAELPLRDGRPWLAAKLDTLSWNTPRPIVWIALGIVLLVLRRPRGWPALVVLLGAASLVLVVHALSQDPQPEFELPLAPLFVFVGLAALLGPRPGSATVPRS